VKNFTLSARAKLKMNNMNTNRLRSPWSQFKCGALRPQKQKKRKKKEERLQAEEGERTAREMRTKSEGAEKRSLFLDQNQGRGLRAAAVTILGLRGRGKTFSKKKGAASFKDTNLPAHHAVLGGDKHFVDQ